jgi:ATP-binding cassette subfamily F protein 3
LLVARRPNLLLLDEPTNHLDIEMRQALTIALQSYEGGLVLVSHDRHLIKSVADTLMLVADGKLREFAGDLDDYQQWLRSRNNGPQPAAPGTPPTKKSFAAGKKNIAQAAAAKKSSRLDPLTRLRQKLEQVEARIAAVSRERALLEGEIAANPSESRLAMRRVNLERDAAYLETQWLEIGIAIEQAEAGENQ